MTRNRISLRGGLSRAVGVADWWLNPNSQPSFIKLYSSQRRAYAQALQMTGKAWGSLWDWEDKMGVRRLASQAGVATPQLLAGPMPIEEIPLSHLPAAFVVKPVHGASRKGVYVLERRGDSYRDWLRAGREVTWEQVVREILELEDKGIDSRRMIAEAALTNDQKVPVFDWKVYAFQGATPLILQIHRTTEGRKSRYYDGEWCDLGKVRRGHDAHDDLPPPSDPTALVAAAAKISSMLPIPFARIDLYEHQGQVFLGEITPHARVGAKV